MIMKYLAMIQARCGSTRLPNKVLLDLCGKPVLLRMVERVRKSISVDEVMVVTSIEKSNLPILKLCAEAGIRVGIGSEQDVLDRYYQTAKLLNPDYVVRITADCPCFDAGLLDEAINGMHLETDYCGMISETFADGLDLEIIKFTALEQAWREAVHSYEREHVTQYIIKHPELFKQQDFVSPVGNFGNQRWTLDEPEDFQVITQIYEYFLEVEENENFNYKDILCYLNRNPEVRVLNEKYQRNEGLQRSIKEDVIVTTDYERNRRDG